MDLSQWSIEELKDALAKIPAEIKRREKESRVRVRSELESLAARYGYSLNELLAEAEEKVSKRAPVPVKYRHPEDQLLTWTGRGRQPKWVADFLSNGGSLDKLRV